MNEEGPYQPKSADREVLGIPAEPAPSLSQRFGLILSQPSSAFRGLTGKRWTWLAPALLIALSSAIAPQFVGDLYAEKQIRGVNELVDRGLVEEDHADELRDRIHEGTLDRSLGKTALATVIAVVYTVVLRFLLPGALLLLGVRFVMQGTAGFATILATLSLASLPAAIRELIRVPLQISKGSLDVSFSPALLTGTDGVGGYTLGLLDFFDLWILYLLVIGLSAVGPITRGRAAALVLPLWLVFSLFKIGMRASPFGAVF